MLIGRGDPPFLIIMNCTTLDFAKKIARKMKRENGGENYCVVEVGDCWDIKKAVDAYGEKILYTTAND